MATYGEVTRRIKFELSADRSATHEQMLDAVYFSMLDVAKRCEPLLLVSQGNVDPLYKWIDDLNFIRKPTKPSGLDNDEIEIDDLLVEAIIHGTCKILSRDNKSAYHGMMLDAINEFEWAIYEGESNVSDVQ